MISISSRREKNNEPSHSPVERFGESLKTQQSMGRKFVFYIFGSIKIDLNGIPANDIQSVGILMCCLLVFVSTFSFAPILIVSTPFHDLRSSRHLPTGQTLDQSRYLARDIDFTTKNTYPETLTEPKIWVVLHTFFRGMGDNLPGGT